MMKVQIMKTNEKISDYFTATNGFFSSLYENAYDDYIELFEPYDATLLDTYFVVNYSDKYVSPLVVNTEHDMWLLTHITYQLNVAKWLKVKAALEAEYDITSPYNMHLTSETSREYTSDVDANSSDTDIVYGFDDNVNGHNDTKNVRVNERNVTNNESSERSQHRFGNTGNRSYANIISAELELRKNSFILSVINDLQDLFTLSVY